MRKIQLLKSFCVEAGFRVTLVTLLTFPAATCFAAAGPTCAERTDTCDTSISTLPYTVSTANRTYCLAPTVSGSGAITITVDNVKVIGQGKAASAITSGISFPNRTCVTANNFHLSSSVNISGGSSNRLLNSVIEGGIGFGGGTHHNLIAGNDFKPTPCATNVVDFPIGALSHHNQFFNNTVFRDEAAAPYQCTCAGVVRNLKCGGSRFFHLDQGTADNEFIGNNIQLLNADNYNGGSPDAEIIVGNYGAVRNIWRNNTMRMKLISGRAGGYAFYLRDGSNDNLLENNAIEVENGDHAVAFVSGAMPNTTTRNMLRSNRFYANSDTLYQQNMGPINYLVGNVIAAFNGRAVTDFGLDGRTQVFVHNTIYAQNGWGLQGEGGNSTRIVRFKHNIVYTTNNIGIGVGPVAFDATGNLIYRADSQTLPITSGFSESSLGTLYRAEPKFQNIAGRDFSLVSGSGARADTSPSDSITVDIGAIPSSVDGSTPSSPSSVDAVASGGGTSALLSWAAASDNRRVVSYRILRSIGNSSLFEFLSETTDLAYTDENLSSSTGYFYKIRAIDLAGNESIDSPIVAINASPPPVDTLAPTAPSQLILQ